MKICVIFDSKGDCPVFASVNPNKDVFVRELSLAVKNDKNLIYGLYPEDYLLLEADVCSNGFMTTNVIPFTDFIKKEVPDDEK